MNKLACFISYFFLIIWSALAFQYSGTYNQMTEYMNVMLMLIIEIISIATIIFNANTLFKSKLNVFVLIWMVYVILNDLVNSKDIFLDVRETLWWPLIYFLFYFIAFNDNKDVLIMPLIKKVIPVIFFVFLVQFLYFRSHNIIVLTEHGMKRYETSNLIFFNSLLLPFAFLLNDKRIKYILLIVGLIVVFYSFKRSAIIYTSLIIIVAIYFDFIQNKSSNQIKGIILSCIIIVVGVYSFRYIDKQTSGNLTQRFELMETDKGSGRMSIYKNVWKLFKEKSIEAKVVGSGNNTVINANEIYAYGKKWNLSAHNDFLEVLYDFGIIGVVLYLMIFAYLLKRLSLLRKIDDRFFQANLSAFIILIVVSMLSHLVIYPNYFAYLVMIWAITEGLIIRRQLTDSQ